MNYTHKSNAYLCLERIEQVPACGLYSDSNRHL
jgi:hypothetical protein